MTNDDFDQLVSKLEGLARRNPGGYKLRVLLLAMLGNAYLGLVFILVAAIFLVLLISIKTLGALALKLIVVVWLFLWMILKSLWVKVLPPSGMAIRAHEAPELFAMIHELSTKLGAPHFHHVLVTEDLNAGVVQIPRLGMFGWHKNYLLLGLPLMKSLTVDQFKAVLAHEFGHLAKGHGRLSNWIYLQRLRWSRLMGQLESNKSKGSFLFTPFLNWYAPYFNAYSFPLARANEYEADATSARLTSPRTAAEALTNVDVVSSYISEYYWPQIYKQADDLPKPNFGPFAGMGDRFALELDQNRTKTWLERALTNQTTSADTHPALSDRLQAIGETPHLNPPEPGQAADQLLGKALAAITENFDRNWLKTIEPAWQERHEQVQESRRRLVELEQQCIDNHKLAPEYAYERAKLTETVGNDADSALDQFRALLNDAPDSALFNFSVGIRLLARDDESGFELIEQAMRLDEEAAVNACEVLRDYCWRHGRQEEALLWHNRFLENTQKSQFAEIERNELLPNDPLDPHGLTEDQLVQLQTELKSVVGLRKAYLVKKRVRHFPNRPFYVLAYTVTARFRLHSKRKAVKILQRIKQAVEFPGETLIINAEGGNARFERKFAGVEGARIV